MHSTYPKILRYRSEPDSSTWSYSNIILLFQRETDDEFGELGWRNGPVFVLELNLYEPESDPIKVPTVLISKYEYDNMTSNDGSVFNYPCSPSLHYMFYDPMYSTDHIKFTENDDWSEYDGHVIDKNYADKKWWGLRRIVGFSMPLVNLTGDNAEEIIFGGFNKLSLR